MSRPGNGKGRPRQGDPNPSSVQNLDSHQRTPGATSATSRRAAIVRGVLGVDLSRHVGENGWLTGTARDAVHRVLVACPPNVAVRVDLGAATWVEPDVVLLLAELVEAADSVEIVGSDAEAVSRVVSGLRGLLGRVAA